MDLRAVWPGRKIGGLYTLIGWVSVGDGLYLSAQEGQRCVVLELREVGRGYALDRACYPGRTVLNPWGLPTEDEVSRFLKQALQKAAKSAKAGKEGNAAVFPAHPALGEFVTIEQVDGKARQTATLNVFYAQGTLRAFLNDRESGLSLCVSADTMAGLLDGLEATLTSDDPGWRPINGSRPARKK